jgi:hypothetical protein
MITERLGVTESRIFVYLTRITSIQFYPQCLHFVYLNFSANNLNFFVFKKVVANTN